MDAITEISYAAISRSLCLFTGTGFSKAVTNDAAPSWQALLENACNHAPDATGLRTSLFPSGGTRPLSLEASAQVIDIELRRNNRNIYVEVANQIRGLTLAGDFTPIIQLIHNYPVDVITTNYDLLFEEIARLAGRSCYSLAPGMPIPHSRPDMYTYHVHGSIHSPYSMVVTSDNYFKFMGKDSYFSKKMSTTLYENTVVILGYSLGDTNLKAIINEHKIVSRNSGAYSNIFFVSRDVVDQRIRDYYSDCYGIRVVDSMSINSFFQQLNAVTAQSSAAIPIATNAVRDFILNAVAMDENYIARENTFYEIVRAISAGGWDTNDQRIVNMLGIIITIKSNIASRFGNWDHYKHLADWLIYLGEIFDISSEAIEDAYLRAALWSMDHMGTEQGYAWDAFNSWRRGWRKILPSNRGRIREFIVSKSAHPPALTVIHSF